MNLGARARDGLCKLCGRCALQIQHGIPVCIPCDACHRGQIVLGQVVLRVTWQLIDVMSCMGVWGRSKETSKL